MTGRSNIYFLKPAGLDGPIKIGCSGLPNARLETLAVWSPWPLELIGSVPGVITDESFLHSCFADQHSHYEWFHSSPELRQAIKEILAAGTVDAVRHKLQAKGQIRTKRKVSPEKRHYLSYRHRINWASRRLRKVDENGSWYEPADVLKIMSRWSGNSNRPVLQPSEEELARLDEFLADPAKHSVIPPWRLPKAEAA